MPIKEKCTLIRINTKHKKISHLLKPYRFLVNIKNTIKITLWDRVTNFMQTIWLI